MSNSFLKAKALEIQQFADSELAGVEELRGGLMIVEKIPRNTLGKIMRHHMKNF